MRPDFQGLPWFECDGLGEDELLIHFPELIIWRICCEFISNQWALIWYRLLFRTLNVTHILSNVAYSLYINIQGIIKLYCPKLGNTEYVQFNII